MSGRERFLGLAIETLATLAVVGAYAGYRYLRASNEGRELIGEVWESVLAETRSRENIARTLDSIRHLPETHEGERHSSPPGSEAAT